MIVPYAFSTYTVVVHEAEEGGYWGEIRELPGCVSQGETMEEFRHNIREALEAVLESELQTPRIEIHTDAIPNEKGFIQFGMTEGDNKKGTWVEINETWTAAT